jgi:5-hydroxyisourate hydrolase
MATATSVSPITTHVLDTARGRPAAGIKVRLEKLAGPSSAGGADEKWQDLAQGATNQDGRVADLLQAGAKLETGVYKLTFDTRAYYDSLDTKTFYPYVSITFEITEPTQHYHVPLLLSPFGYSTYRGS